MSDLYTARLENGFEGWLVHYKRVSIVWDQVQPLLLKALERTRQEYGLEEVLEGIQNLQMQLWCVSRDNKIHAAMVTEIRRYPRYPTLQILILAGEHSKHWNRLWPLVENFAREWKCEYIEALARPGVERLFREATGMKEQYRLLSVPVSQGPVH